MNVYIYKERKKERDRQKNRERESTNKTNTTEVWFNFHIKYRGENIAKSLPLSGKN